MDADGKDPCPHDCPWVADGAEHCGWCPECSPEVPEWTT